MNIPLKCLIVEQNIVECVCKEIIKKHNQTTDNCDDKLYSCTRLLNTYVCTCIRSA